jgi:hypothetical protein
MKPNKKESKFKLALRYTKELNNLYKYPRYEIVDKPTFVGYKLTFALREDTNLSRKGKDFLQVIFDILNKEQGYFTNIYTLNRQYAEHYLKQLRSNNERLVIHKDEYDKIPNELSFKTKWFDIVNDSYKFKKESYLLKRVFSSSVEWKVTRYKSTKVPVLDSYRQSRIDYLWDKLYGGDNLSKYTEGRGWLWEVDWDGGKPITLNKESKLDMKKQIQEYFFEKELDLKI